MNKNMSMPSSLTRGFWLLMLGGLLLSAAPHAAFAQDPIHKLGRGLGNVFTCWIEIPKNFHQGMQEENPLSGAAWGIVKGVGLGFTRLAVGAYETISFPLPYPKDFASPYAGMELPDYPWD